MIYLSIIVMAGIVVWNKVDDVTHGVASFRFSGRNSVGDKLDDVTSGRIDLFTEELCLQKILFSVLELVIHLPNDNIVSVRYTPLIQNIRACFVNMEY